LLAPLHTSPCLIRTKDWWTYEVRFKDPLDQSYYARKVNCSCVYSAYILKPVLSGRNLWTRIDASMFVLYPRRLKVLNFDNFDNLHNSFLWPEYFIDFFMWKMDPMSGCDIRLVFTLPPRDCTLQYKRCVHLWNNFPCIITLH